VDTLKFGIIGVGNISRTHAAAILDTPGAELAAVATRNKMAGKSFVEEYGGTLFEDYRYLINRNDLDVVSICTPHYLHAPMTVDAANAGKHVLCEKPMAIGIGECNKMIAECERANVKLGVIFQCRFEPLVKLLKAAFDSSRLGQLLLVNTNTLWFRNDEYYSGSSWRGTLAYEGGGVFINQAIHSIDLLLWLAGMPSRVTAQTRTLNHQIEVEDCGAAIMEYANGCLGIIQATTCAYPEYPERLEFYGTRGSVIYHKGLGRLEWQLKDPHENRIDESSLCVSDSTSLNFRIDLMIAEYKDFVSAIRDDRTPFIGGREGRRSIELVEAIYRSAREKITVNLQSSI
jgi:UDP-N-acetyl-2-amino-2-deoxyglucuronate dehydrogenase